MKDQDSPGRNLWDQLEDKRAHVVELRSKLRDAWTALRAASVTLQEQEGMLLRRLPHFSGLGQPDGSYLTHFNDLQQITNAVLKLGDD